MRKILTLASFGIIWALAGCEQTTDTFEQSGGLSNEPARTDPDVQIGRSDDVDTARPAEAPIEREIEPTIVPENTPETEGQDSGLQDSLDRPNREPAPLN